MIKAVLFDLDDTLVDFTGMKKAEVREAAKAMVKAGLGMKVSDVVARLDKVSWEVGIESSTAITEFLKRVGKLEDRILAAGINGYVKGRIEATRPADGAIETIKKLKKRGLKVGVVTDAPRLKAWQRLNTIGMDRLFDVVIAHEDTGRKKPHGNPFRAALKRLGVKPEEALMVGDWYERDIEGAKRLGMKTAWVGGKCRGAEDYCIRSIRELEKIIS